MTHMNMNGYVLVYVGKYHHLADAKGRAYEHRLIAEMKIGRQLRPGEIVHHVNDDKTDNRPENIEVLPSRWHHNARHARPDSPKRKPDEPNPVVACECGCGREFLRYDKWRRPRRYVHSSHARYVDEEEAER